MRRFVVTDTDERAIADCRGKKVYHTRTASDLSDAPTPTDVVPNHPTLDIRFHGPYAPTETDVDRIGMVAHRRYWSNCGMCSDLFSRNQTPEAAETSFLFARHHAGSSVATGVCDNCFERMVANSQEQQRIVDDARCRAPPRRVDSCNQTRRCVDDALGGKNWATKKAHQTETAAAAHDKVRAVSIPAAMPAEAQRSGLCGCMGTTGNTTETLPQKKRRAARRAKSDADAGQLLLVCRGAPSSAGTVLKPPIATRNRFVVLSV
jgi:hypothetical protein